MGRLAELENFYRGRRVLLTGHTGFKGAWLCLALSELGVEVTGIALPPDGGGVYELAGVAGRVRSHPLDIRDRPGVTSIVAAARPEVVFHLAAQALVPDSFRDPVTTFDVNVVGTASILAACSATPSVQSVVAVTSDKVYVNDGSGRALVESDHLGGGDPYSASKSGAEMVISSWRHSFLSDPTRSTYQLGSARAGNVIGGGDRARDRVIPDVVDALSTSRPVMLRNPNAVRPWQFVLEPVIGYLQYAAQMADPVAGHQVPEALNFGPDPTGICTVSELVDRMISAWGQGSWAPTDERSGPEASLLVLDSSAAHRALGWRPRLDLEDAVGLTVDWYRSAAEGRDCAGLSLGQLHDYLSRLDYVDTGRRLRP